ncbi:hypothetical protein EC991_000780 [Linnemannia zychae]|nr:hypothetical protein EC991_000780 [Linnemannia zychae]
MSTRNKRKSPSHNDSNKDIDSIKHNDKDDEECTQKNPQVIAMKRWLNSAKGNGSLSDNSSERADTQLSQHSDSKSDSKSTPSSTSSSQVATPRHTQDDTRVSTNGPSGSTMKRRKLDDSSTSDRSDYHHDGSNSDDHQDDSIYHTPDSASSYSRAGNSRLPTSSSTLAKAKSYVCQHPGCGKAYTKPSRLAEHELVHSGLRPFKCPEPGCGASFRREAHFAIHYKSQHGGSRDFVCPQPGCTSAFHSQDKLARHFKTHSEFADPLLATAAITLLSAPPSPTPSQRHNRTRSNSVAGSFVNMDFSGDDSDGTYDTASQQQEPRSRRMSVSSEAGDRLAEEIMLIRPYACTWEGCTKRFTKHQKLKAHVCMVHEGRKPYPCTVDGCDKSFQTPSKLRKHSMSHSEAKRYACAYPGCGEYFSKWSLLQKHTTVSHKTTQCETCGKNILKRNLTPHMKIHDAFRPEVPCPVEGCQKVFSTQRTLTTHIKVSHPDDLGPPQFKCDYKDCGQAFSFKHVLERHIRNIHTNPKTSRKRRGDALDFDVIDELAGFDNEDEITKMPFACQVPGCNRRYTTEFLLRRHLKSRAHKSKKDSKVTGLSVLQAMDQVENQAIRDMIALHLDSEKKPIDTSSNA